MPLDVWTIGFADRRGLRPHPPPPTRRPHRIDVDEAEGKSDVMTIAPARSEPVLKSAGLHLRRRLRLSHDRGPPHSSTEAQRRLLGLNADEIGVRYRVRIAARIASSLPATPRTPGARRTRLGTATSSFDHLHRDCASNTELAGSMG